MSKTYNKLNPETNNDPEFEKALQKAKEKLSIEKQEKKEFLDDLTGQFKQGKTTGFYNYIMEIDKKSLFFFCGIFLIVFNLINRLIFSISSIVAILIATLVVYFLNERRRTTQSSDMKELEIKLVRITPTPKYFHLDAGIVELVYSIKEFRTYNEQAFVDMITSIDKFLATIYDVENNVDNCHFSVESAQNFKKLALNSLMSIIFRVPQDNLIYKKLRKAANSLHFILNHHISQIKTICNNKVKKIGLNSTNKIVITNHPTPFDTNYKNSFDFF